MKKHVGIVTPCDEKRSNMLPLGGGDFCKRCSKIVHDFSGMSAKEIRAALYRMQDREVCGRLSNEQEKALNDDFELWQASNSEHMKAAMFFSLFLVFGLTLFSCSDQNTISAIAAIRANFANQVEQVDAEKPKATNEENIELVTSEEIDAPELASRKILRNSETVSDSFVDSPSVFTEIIWDTQVDGGIGYSPFYKEHLDEMVTIEKVGANHEFSLDFNVTAYPNPTSDLTTVRVVLPAKSDNLQIKVVSMDGKVIADVYNGTADRGASEYQINLADEISGTYLIYVQSGNLVESLRVVKL